MSREKRKACLLQADPAMYPQNWFHANISYQNLYIEEAREYRASWLLPYINLESLTAESSRFLGLLHNRVQSSPEQWAPYDNRQLALDWELGALKADRSNKCLIIYGTRYGELTDWEAEAAHRWDIVGFPRARLILEAQYTLLSLLRKIVDQLLDGVDKDRSGYSDKWKQITTLGFKAFSHLEFWSSYTNQPFSAVPVFDIDALLSTAKVRF